MSMAPTRGVLLTVLLIVLSVTPVLAGFAYVAVWHRMLVLYPHWAAFTFLAIAVLRLLVVVGIWRWSKIAVIAYVALAALNIVVCSAIGAVEQSYLGTVGALLLIALLWGKWPNMPWRPLANYSFKATVTGRGDTRAPGAAP
jgi:hypothetical protein